MNHDTLKKQLILHEGLSLKPYKDSKGIWTCWVGRNLQRGLTTEELILLIQEGNSEKFADFILENDITKHCQLLDKYALWWRTMSETRQLVLADMAFNLGVGPSEEDKDGKLLTFKNTLRAMQEGRYEDAAKGMEDSPWYRQVGRRAVKLVDMMRKG